MKRMENGSVCSMCGVRYIKGVTYWWKFTSAFFRSLSVRLPVWSSRCYLLSLSNTYLRCQKRIKCFARIFERTGVRTHKFIDSSLCMCACVVFFAWSVCIMHKASIYPWREKKMRVYVCEIDRSIDGERDARVKETKRNQKSWVKYWLIAAQISQ